MKNVRFMLKRLRKLRVENVKLNIKTLKQKIILNI
nr:MAG TPA: hypothetical protein [Caudoviricetes sp.]